MTLEVGDLAEWQSMPSYPASFAVAVCSSHVVSRWSADGAFCVFTDCGAVDVDRLSYGCFSFTRLARGCELSGGQ